MQSGRVTVTRRQLIANLIGAACAAAGTRNSIYNPKLVAHTSLWLDEAEFRHQRLLDIREEAFRTIARAGYRRVELVAEFVTPDLRDSSLAALRKHKLEPAIVSVSGPMYESRAAKESRSRVRELARFMREKGALHLNLTAAPRPDGRPLSASELDTQAYEFNRMGQELRELEVNLLVHHGIEEMLNRAREWQFTVAHTEPQLVSFCVDVATVARAGLKTSELIGLAGPRIRSLHLRNPLHGIEQERLAQGDIDLGEIAAVLQQITYDGFLVVELKYDEHTAHNRPLATNLSLSRRYVQDLFGSRPGYLPVDMGPHVRRRS